MPNVKSITNVKYQNMDYNLEERTAKFGESAIRFAKSIKKDVINIPLIGQFIRSATSIGANYCEADGGSSKKDFRNKICISRKEAKETKHWLRMIAEANSDLKDEARKLFREAQELTLIFSSIVKSLDNHE